MSQVALLVSYDLRKPGRNYDSLYKALQEAGSYARTLESVWLIQSTASPTYWRDKLRQHIDASDGLIVIQLSSSTDWATVGIANNLTSWLQAVL